MLDKKDLQAIGELMDEKIGASEARMIEKIGAVETRLEGVENRLGKVETRLEGVETRLDKVENRLDKVETRLDAVEVRVDTLETRVAEKIEERAGESEARMMAMMEAYFGPMFNQLADQIQLIQQKLMPRERVEVLEDRVDVTEAVLREHSREIQALKKAL